MRSLEQAEVEEEGLLEDSHSKDARTSWKLPVSAAIVLAGVASLGFYHRIRQADVSDVVNEMSEPYMCLRCHEKECSLGGTQWTKCPADRPYFSEMHCKCLSSEVCDDESPVAASCEMCQNCFEHACHVGAEHVICPSSAPIYNPHIAECGTSCEEDSHVATVQPEQPPLVVPFVCPKSTYGQCKVLGCHQDRGPTVCNSGECMCDYGHCAYRGKCLKEAAFDKEEHLCQDITFRTCRMFGCPSTLGKTKCDGLFNGFGTYNCLCEEGYCYDPLKSQCTKHG
eukprot:Skav224862  [mRNA]  locus=scaffold322:339357:346672:+ [translate_table: standard]